MNTIEKIHRKAEGSKKTIVLPESEDSRVREAAKFIEKEDIARVILLDEGSMPSRDKERYVKEYFQLQRTKGISLDEANEILKRPLYYAAMMVRMGDADGFVAGASHTTPDVARAALRCLGIDEKWGTLLSCFIMVVPDCPYGDNGTFVFADCGIIPNPNSHQLACIALVSAQLAQEVLEIIPKVSFLSYSTKGSAKSKSIDLIQEALKQTKSLNPDLLVDGELQVDAAIITEVARIKYPESPLGGKANVLIFPNLEAGNIGYKLVQRLARARAIGPLLLGLNKACSDLSRGCSVDDIVDCVAVTAIRATKI